MIIHTAFSLHGVPNSRALRRQFSHHWVVFRHMRRWAYLLQWADTECLGMIQSLECANKLLKTGTKEQVSSEHYTVLKATGGAQAGGKFEYGVSETTSPGFGAVTWRGVMMSGTRGSVCYACSASSSDELGHTGR